MKVLVLTPLPLEYDAVVRHLTARKSVIRDAAAYEMGTFSGKHHAYEVIVREPGMKNVDMALATEKAIRQFQPQVVLLIGIAGGVKDVKIGDVVIASSAFNYDSGKETGDGFLARPAEYVFSEELLANAQIVSRNADWKKRTSDGAADSKVVIGPIAAGDKVVAGIDNPTFERIKQNLSHIKALEMESGGFGRSVQSHRNLHALVIRGISDLCAGKAETDKENWQPVAAERAAAVGFEMLWSWGEKGHSEASERAPHAKSGESKKWSIHKDDLEDLVQKHIDSNSDDLPSTVSEPNGNVTYYTFIGGNHHHNTADAIGYQYFDLKEKEYDLISDLFNALKSEYKESIKLELQIDNTTPQMKTNAGNRIFDILRQSGAWLNASSEDILKNVSASVYYDFAKSLFGF